jgi:hypothetical protein
MDVMEYINSGRPSYLQSAIRDMTRNKPQESDFPNIYTSKKVYFDSYHEHGNGD